MQTKNYITPTGYAKLQDEFNQLLNVERPDVVRTVAWAASNGDRSENADYIYGKRRLRQIDQRIHFLMKRLENAEVIDGSHQHDAQRVYFGAQVTLFDVDSETEHRYRIVGEDEFDPAQGAISWVSPLAKQLLGKRLGERVEFTLPQATSRSKVFEIIEILYTAHAPTASCKDA